MMDNIDIVTPFIPIEVNPKQAVKTICSSELSKRLFEYIKPYLEKYVPHHAVAQKAIKSLDQIAHELGLNKSDRGYKKLENTLDKFWKIHLIGIVGAQGRESYDLSGSSYWPFTDKQGKVIAYSAYLKEIYKGIEKRVEQAKNKNETLAKTKIT